MTRILAATLAAGTLLVGGGAWAAEQTVTLAVDNMYCELCPTTVRKSLEKVGGVAKVVVSFEKKTATVTYDDSKTTLGALTAATTNAGYPSHAAQNRGQPTLLSIQG